MENLLKKFFYTGVGLVSITAERLQKTVDEMVGEGKVSEDEGKKIVDSFIEDVEKRRDEFESNMKESIEKFTSNIETPEFMKNNFFTELFERIEKIEEKLGIEYEKRSENPVKDAVEDMAKAAEEVKENVEQKATDVQDALASGAENVQNAAQETIDNVKDAIDGDEK
ncbi:MAG: hypothetical protein AAFY71_26355 [Bacteroidota bacterium]